MNRENVQTVRDAIAAAPPEEFNYNHFFSDVRNGRSPSCPEVIPKPHCGTAGCVAGWTLMLFRIEADSRGESWEVAVQRLLGIDYATYCNLCYRQCGSADREAALARLDHLLQHGNLRDYDFHREWMECHGRACAEERQRA